MALNNISELNETAGSNVDLAGISILGTGLLSTADDSFRTTASFLKKWWDDIGGVNTVAGTGDAVTVTTLTLYTALKTGMRMQFIATAANTTAATLNLDGIGAKALRKISGGTDVALVAGDIPGAKFRVDVGYDAAANSAAGAWIVLGAAPVSSATTSAQGIVELATVAEALAGTDAVRAVTPNGLYYPTGHLSPNGLVLTNDAGDTTNDIVNTAGTARDSTDTVNIAIASALIKRMDANWAVGTNQGGLDTGSASNTTYYDWLIKRSDTGAVDRLFSLSATAPTMPANYDSKALIGSFARVGGVNQAPRSYAQDRKGATDWVAYTPTFTGCGTATNISFYSRRSGGNLEIEGKFTAGTPTATEARITLGFNGTSANVTTNATFVASIRPFGSFATDNSAVGALGAFVLAEQSVSYMTFGYAAAGVAGLTKQNGSAIFGAGSAVAIYATIPISGW